MKKKAAEPRFPECPGCEHFRAKGPCRYSRDCQAGEFYELRLDDCVPTEDDFLDNMMRKKRRDD